MKSAIKEYLKKLVVENSGLINEGDFDGLYGRCKNWVRQYLTELLYAADIDPLNYLTSVPRSFLGESSKIEKITIPPTITDIGPVAFAECPNLKEVSILSEGDIGAQAFYKCEKLERVSVTGKINYISSGCFNACSHLKEVTLPASLKIIGPEVFDNSGLYKGKIKYLGSMREWLNVNIINYNGVLYTCAIECSDGTLYYNDAVHSWREWK